MIHMATQQAGYGGDVLKFTETPTDWYAIHRVWLLKPEQHRLERLKSDNVAERITVTAGCVNVMPDVYEKLLECCSTEELEIQ